MDIVLLTALVAFARFPRCLPCQVGTECSSPSADADPDKKNSLDIKKKGFKGEGGRDEITLKL